MFDPQHKYMASMGLYVCISGERCVRVYQSVSLIPDVNKMAGEGMVIVFAT